MSEWTLGASIVVAAMKLSGQGATVADILDHSVATADDALPAREWTAIRNIDHRADLGALVEWIPRQLSEAPPKNLTAVCFGLHEVGQPDLAPGNTEAVVQLTGGPGYPEDPGWLFRQNWRPAGYAPTPGLRSILPIAASGGAEVFSIAAYAVVLSYTVGLVASAFDAIDPAIVLRERPLLGVAAGFHDGDIAEIGQLTVGGLDRSSMAWI